MGVLMNARKSAEQWCESEEGREYFTKFADEYALEDQEREWICNWEGKVPLAFAMPCLTRVAGVHMRAVSSD